eukprot:m.222399 g.222399  ORF g.222399 m.222399 type:complete len:50 (+) comp15934_c1_seq1:381-530(+)
MMDTDDDDFQEEWRKLKSGLSSLLKSISDFLGAKLSGHKVHQFADKKSR